MQGINAKATEFGSELGFNQNDTVLSKEQSAISKITKLFSNKKFLLQYSILGYNIDFYFPKHKLAIDYEHFESGKICYHINKSNKKLTEESTKKYLIDKVSRRLLELVFEKNNSIIKGIKVCCKENIAVIIKHENLLFRL